jgi:ketosteroid isomerase-like protein
MRTIPKSILILSGLLLVFSCCPKHDAQLAEKELMATDSLFSVMSSQQGMQKAFLAYFDSSVVLLRTNKMPLTGIAALRKHFETFSDTSFILTWKPLKAIASREGDFGYTYGIYEINDKATAKKTESGTYITIWKRMGDGKWKATFDAGNEGTGDAVQ